MLIGKHVAQLFEAVEQPVPTSRQPLIGNFDWSGHGVSHRYVIFMTGRCGSTWLASLLKNTGKAGFPTEYFNEKGAAGFYDRTAPGLAGYFGQVVRQLSSNRRFGLKIDGERLSQIEDFIDWPTVFPTGGTFTVFMYRRDLLAQAWSWVSARKSGKFHIDGRSPSQGTPASQASVVTTRDMVNEMVRIRKYEEYLASFFATHGYQPYYLDYESMATSPAIHLRLILRFLGLEASTSAETGASVRADTSKLTYSGKDEFLADFAYRNRELIMMLQEDRFRVSSGMLSGLVV